MTGLFQWLVKWHRENQERQYLQGLSGTELMDAGISRADFMTAMGAPKDTRERMQSMAAAHDLPRDALDKEHWRALDIARACGQCGERSLCKSWLDGKADDVEAEAFCPNAKHYAEMALSHGAKTAAKPRPKKDRDDEQSW